MVYFKDALPANEGSDSACGLLHSVTMVCMYE